MSVYGSIEIQEKRLSENGSVSGGTKNPYVQNPSVYARSSLFYAHLGLFYGWPKNPYVQNSLFYGDTENEKIVMAKTGLFMKSEKRLETYCRKMICFCAPPNTQENGMSQASLFCQDPRLVEALLGLFLESTSSGPNYLSLFLGRCPERAPSSSLCGGLGV